MRNWYFVLIVELVFGSIRIGSFDGIGRFDWSLISLYIRLKSKMSESGQEEEEEEEEQHRRIKDLEHCSRSKTCFKEVIFPQDLPLVTVVGNKNT